MAAVLPDSGFQLVAYRNHAWQTQTGQVTVTVRDTHGDAKAGLNVYVFDGNAYTGFNGITDDAGQLVLTLPEGSYRFRADYNGTQFWSDTENHSPDGDTCRVPNCESAAITVTLPVTVNVAEPDGTALAGLTVYAFDGNTYTNFSAVTDADGQAVFTLPQGSYRFRADRNGTQFWSSADNACALPGCEATAITVTKPVTVVVRSQSGEPYLNLPVYAFAGAAYTGYSGTTDANGAVVFTLPQGEYRFRADYDGVPFWSEETDACALPGCETAAVTLPGGTGESQVTIQYEYDALNRMTAARYSNGIAFAYTYDAAGNVLEYAVTLNGQTKTTSYTYDEANQLLTATQEGVTWHYTYDGNGSLIQITPGENVANGAKRYSYNTAGFLVKVETYTTDWQPQAEMAYDGLGNRLAMTGYADGQSVTTQYALDGGQTLLASAEEQTTAYLYGLGAIGEQTDAWAYSLPDGTNTARQLVNGSGKVTLVSSYTPWGDTLSIQGTGGFTFGYFGGMMDTATGLLYVGNGQYYDPQTGRFLNRDAKTDQTNPYVPWKSDPAGAMLAPLAFLAMVYGKKKSRGKWDNLVIALVLLCATAMSVSGCTKTPQAVTVGSITATITPIETPSPTQETTYAVTINTPTQSVTVTLTPTITATLPAGCVNGVWWTGFEKDSENPENLEKIAKRIYYEGASSYSDTTRREKVFMAMAWALRSINLHRNYQSYIELTANPFVLSISTSKDGAVWDNYDNDYKEITRCILNSEPCSYGPNPWNVYGPTDLVEWISPQNNHRLNADGSVLHFHSSLIPTCPPEGCELPDIRSRDWMVNDLQANGYVEKYFTLPDYNNECYVSGVYFYHSSNKYAETGETAFTAATHGKQTKVQPPEGYLVCPQLGESDKLPAMPALYNRK
jgi:RHS repeat-associated protein